MKSYVSNGMLDVATKSCPCLYGIMKAFDINWNTITGGKTWFVSKIGISIQEMYDNGNIGEDFYDEDEFPLDIDKDGKTYILNSVKDHLCPSKISIIPKCWQIRRN